MKVIFLDIDGVLNSDLWNDSHQRELCGGILIDMDKVALLGELVKKTNAKVVLHSGWRFWFNNNLKPLRIESEKLVEMFQTEDIEIYDVTPDDTTEEIRAAKKFSLVKAKEILDWLNMHKEVENWIVIDDLDLRNERIFRQQIKPDRTIGLTRQDIERAETMLLK